MNRRFTHTLPTQRLTGGTDRPEPACQGRPEPYDVLVDQTAGPAFHAALRVARDICGGCPLKLSCWSANSGEPWVEALIGLAKPKRAVAVCGTESGYTRHLRTDKTQPCDPCKAAHAHHERERKRGLNRAAYEARLEALREFAEQGLSPTQVADRLGMERHSVYSWCRRHGFLDLWESLQGVAA